MTGQNPNAGREPVSVAQKWRHFASNVAHATRNVALAIFLSIGHDTIKKKGGERQTKTKFYEFPPKISRSDGIFSENWKCRLTKHKYSGNLVQKKGGDINLSARFTQIVPDELNGRLEQLKEKIGMSKSSIVNAAIEEYIRTRDTETFEKRIEALEKEVFKK